jgi:hypothetical protein
MHGTSLHLFLGKKQSFCLINRKVLRINVYIFRLKSGRMVYVFEKETNQKEILIMKIKFGICVLLFAGGTEGAIVPISGPFYMDSSAASNVSLTQSPGNFTASNSSGSAAQVGGFASLGETVTLDDVGDFIQFVGTSSGATNNNTYALRVGFFNSQGNTIDSDRDADMASVLGVFGAAPFRTSGAGNQGAVYRQTAGSSFLGLAASSPGGLTGVTQLGSSVQQPNGHGEMTFRLEYLTGGDLQINFSSTGGYAMSRSIAAADVPSYSFDSVALGFVLNNGSSRSYSGVQITTIPEPGTLALLCISACALFGYRRRM